ncbi:hypothetical protein ENBRE01_2958 [Enteropsectra breve]|nr:hypothetical protein ENBRE01_2958 [Enteropsectra breve]
MDNQGTSNTIKLFDKYKWGFRKVRWPASTDTRHQCRHSVLLQETHLTKKLNNLFGEFNTIYFLNQNAIPRQGMLVAVKRRLTVSITVERNTHNIQTIILRKGIHKIRLINAYMPIQKKNQMPTLKKISKEFNKDKCIAMGDWNNFPVEAKVKIQKLVKKDLYLITINQPTHFCGTRTDNELDYAITNIKCRTSIRIYKTEEYQTMLQ